MSEEKKMNESTNPSPADELTKTKKPGDVQLNEEDLGKVSGGFLKITMKTE